jgi:hypothetical protein
MYQVAFLPVFCHQIVFLQTAVFEDETINECKDDETKRQAFLKLNGMRC